MTQEFYQEVLQKNDPEIAQYVASEKERQETTICLIPSENYISRAVAYALATPFSNKYSEGYPHTWKDGIKEDKNGRYYQGQALANSIEKLAIERALKLFTPNPEEYHANVQPLSGAPANLAVLSAFLQPGDTFMGLGLDFGGHLTHGHKVSVTSKFYNAVQYGLNEQGELDYNEIERIAIECKPKLIMCGATAYPKKINFEKFGKIAKQVGAILVADVAHICGLCVTGQHPHPFPHADVITTTTHKILRGPRSGLIVCKKQYGQQIDKAVFPGLQGGPHMSTLTAMAVAFKEALSDDYKIYTEQVVKNAKVLAEKLKEAGFKLISGGTENHLILMDVVNSSNGLAVKSGSYLSNKLEEAGIVTNKNAVPGDLKPWIPSGVRIGTPAVTSLGMKEDEMIKISEFIIRATKNAENTQELNNISKEVAEFVYKFKKDAVNIL